MEYYNLVNPAPEVEEDGAREGSVPPSIPRRKPHIASPDSPKLRHGQTNRTGGEDQQGGVSSGPGGVSFGPGGVSVGSGGVPSGQGGVAAGLGNVTTGLGGVSAGPGGVSVGQGGVSGVKCTVSPTKSGPGAVNTLGRSFRKRYLSRRKRGTQCHCKNAGKYYLVHVLRNRDIEMSKIISGQSLGADCRGCSLAQWPILTYI